MAGAAAVLGAMRAVAMLKPAVEVRAYVAAAENMISGTAYRVSDVLTSLSGKTIEVLNTDAEGRLTLADAITYADRQGADLIVELSTLTGACVVALGEKVAGLFANDARWGRQVQEAAERAGEKVWPLPLEEEYLGPSSPAPLISRTPTGAAAQGVLLRRRSSWQSLPTNRWCTSISPALPIPRKTTRWARPAVRGLGCGRWWSCFVNPAATSV